MRLKCNYLKTFQILMTTRHFRYQQMPPNRTNFQVQNFLGGDPQNPPKEKGARPPSRALPTALAFGTRPMPLALGFSITNFLGMPPGNSQMFAMVKNVK